MFRINLSNHLGHNVQWNWASMQKTSIFRPLCLQNSHQSQRWMAKLTATTANKLFVKSASHKNDWNHAVREAERIVHYTASFLSDQRTNITKYLRKLDGSNHPLLKTSKSLLLNGKGSVHVWGLIVLLISKAAGYDAEISNLEQDKCDGILNSQRHLAELTQMLRVGQLVYNSLVNLQKSTEAAQDIATYNDMAYGNKISLLIGDYLLSESSVALGNLRNQEVMGLISSAIRDFSESEFIGDRDEQNNPLPSKPGTHFAKSDESPSNLTLEFDHGDILAPLNIAAVRGDAEKEWEYRNILNGGSLIAKACKSAMKLAKHKEDMQLKAYLFGKHLHLAWQASLDAEPFQLSFSSDTKFSLISAPILFHLAHDSQFYDEIENGKLSINNIDYGKIHKAILQGPGLEMTQKLHHKHSTGALKALEIFPSNDAKDSLGKILGGIKY